jgi:hypothetical protein
VNNTLPKISNYGQYSSDNYGVNSLRVDVGPLAIWFSYTTPVAFQLDGRARVVRQNQWGPTTGKHLNWIDGNSHKSRVTSDEFERLFDEALQQCGLKAAA